MWFSVVCALIDIHRGQNVVDSQYQNKTKVKKWWAACSVQLSSYGCTLHDHHFFYNIDAFNIFPWMEVFIESPVYMRLKAEDQPRKNIYSKIWQSDTTFFLDRGELVYVFSISEKRTTSNSSVNLNIKIITNENCFLLKRFLKVSKISIGFRGIEDKWIEQTPLNLSCLIWDAPLQ